MCSYGSFAKNAGGAMNSNLRKKSEQEADRPRGLSLLEKRLGLSTREEDVAYVLTAQKGLVDSLGDILAHQAGDNRRPSSLDVVVRIGSRASGKPSSALHEAAKHGHAGCCRLLLDHGALVNFKLELSRVLIPLHYAKTPQVASTLLEAGSYSKRQRSDKRLPDMASYARTQKREEVAVVIDEWNEQLKQKLGRRRLARANLQLIWDRLNGMVVGLRRIRQFQREFTEKFYSPDYGGFMKVGAARFECMAGTATVNVVGEEEVVAVVKEKEVVAVVAVVREETAVSMVVGGSGLKAAMLLRQAQRCFPVDGCAPHPVSPAAAPMRKKDLRVEDNPTIETIEEFVDQWYFSKVMTILREIHVVATA